MKKKKKKILAVKKIEMLDLKAVTWHKPNQLIRIGISPGEILSDLIGDWKFE